VAAGVARVLLKFAASKGADQPTLLERAGLDPEELLDHDTRLPLANYMALMRAGKELCSDPALALHFGEAIDMAELSIVGLIGRAAETTTEAFAQINRYSRLIVEVDTGDANRFALTRENGQIWFVDNLGNPADCFELIEGGFARGVCSARRFSDKTFLKAVHFTYPDPGYRAEYERIFGVPVVFASNRNAMLFEEDWLNQRIQIEPRYAFGILSAHADALLKKLENSKTVRGRVEGLLMPVLHTGAANVDAIAGKLGVSRQTLFRKLKAEGVTFERVLDQLRQTLAIDYLSAKKVSVNETAYLVGFSDPAAFSRAFKRWTGSSPRQFKA